MEAEDCKMLNDFGYWSSTDDEDWWQDSLLKRRSSRRSEARRGLPEKENRCPNPPDDEAAAFQDIALAECPVMFIKRDSETRKGGWLGKASWELMMIARHIALTPGIFLSTGGWVELTELCGESEFFMNSDPLGIAHLIGAQLASKETQPFETGCTREVFRGIKDDMENSKFVC